MCYGNDSFVEHWFGKHMKVWRVGFVDDDGNLRTVC